MEVVGCGRSAAVSSLAARILATCPGGTVVETRDWTEPDLCGCWRERLEVWSEENAVSGLVEGLVEGS